ADARKLYDAGQYQQAAAAAQAAADDPRMVYLLAQSQQKLGQRDEARQAYERLAARPDGDPWHDIGRPAGAQLAKDAGGAGAARWRRPIKRSSTTPTSRRRSTSAGSPSAPSRTWPTPRPPSRRRPSSIRTGPMRTTTPGSPIPRSNASIRWPLTSTRS